MINFNKGLESPENKQNTDEIETIEEINDLLDELLLREDIERGHIENIISEIEIEIQKIQLENPDSLENKLKISRLQRLIKQVKEKMETK